MNAKCSWFVDCGYLTFKKLRKNNVKRRAMYVVTLRIRQSLLVGEEQ